MNKKNLIICLLLFAGSLAGSVIAQPSKKYLARALYDFTQKQVIAMLPLDMGNIICDNYIIGKDCVQGIYTFKDNNLFKTYKANQAEHKYHVMVELANANAVALKWTRIFHIDSDMDLKYVYYSPDKSDSYSFIITVDDFMSMLDFDSITPEYRREIVGELFSYITSNMPSIDVKMSITDTAVVTTVYTPVFIFSDPCYDKEKNDLRYINSEITPVNEPGFIFEIIACYLDIDVEYVFVDSNNGQTYKITADRKILQKKVSDWLETQQ